MRTYKSYLCTLILFTCNLLYINAQPLKSMHFMSEWSQRHQANPAFAPSAGYIGLFIGDIGLQGTSNLGINKLLFPKNSELVSFMHPSVSSNEFLSGLKKRNMLYESIHYNILSFGWHTSQNSFWSVGLDMDQVMDLSLPYDLFAFAKNGMNSHNTRYSLHDFGVSTHSTGSLYIGYSRDILPNLRVGAKVRAIMGLGGASVNYDRMDVTLSDDKWAISSQGSMTIFSSGNSQMVDADGNLNIGDIDPLDFASICGKGFSVDFGASYKPIPRLTVAASVFDLGTIYWNETSIKRGVAQSDVIFEGFKEVDPGNLDIDDQIDQLEKDLEKLYTFKYDPNSRIAKTGIRARMNVSAEYSFLDFVPSCDLRLGLLWDTRFTQMGALNELTAIASVQPTSWFTFATSVGMIQKQFNSIGAAMNFSLRGFNFFIATDYIPFNYTPQFVPVGPLNLTAQFGINWSLRSSPKKIKK